MTMAELQPESTSNVQHDEAVSKCEITSKGQHLSKRQQKKLQKQERKLAFRGIKRQQEKERKKKRRQDLIEKGVDVGPTRKKLKSNKMADSSCRLKIAVDCSFDNYMCEKDVRMLIKQLQHCYSINRRAADPIQFHATSVGDKLREILESVGDYKNWDVYFKTNDYVTEFGKENVVYLSSDSKNVLETLDESKAYIIGGLVDHNHHKGLCHRLAEEKGIAHAQLPISEFIEMKTRKILSVDHVFEILLRFTESFDWKDAFFKVIPLRKGAVEKSQAAEDRLLNTEIDGSQTRTVTDSQRGNERLGNTGDDSSTIDSNVTSDNGVVYPQCKILPPAWQVIGRHPGVGNFNHSSDDSTTSSSDSDDIDTDLFTRRQIHITIQQQH